MAKSPDDFRANTRLAVTIAAFLGSVTVAARFHGTRQFHIWSLVATMIVLACGLFTLATYRNRRERIIGWIAFAVASFAWFIEWSANSIFLFRTRDIIGIMEYLGY